MVEKVDELHGHWQILGLMASKQVHVATPAHRRTKLTGTERYRTRLRTYAPVHTSESVVSIYDNPVRYAHPV